MKPTQEHAHDYERGIHMAEAFGISGRVAACAICGELRPPSTCPTCGAPKMRRATWCLPCWLARPLAERFWEKVDMSGECWTWTRAVDGHGYGAIRADSKRQTASRVAWSLTYGPIPAGMGVLHRCDTPLCVRPEHLFLGTQGDNMRDMIAKGRASWQKAG